MLSAVTVRVRPRSVLPLLAVVLVLAGCAALGGGPLEQRTTQGPSAEDVWLHRVALQTGREPTYEERRLWETDIDRRVSDYLRDHPEVANNPDVMAFKFWRQPSVGMNKEQVLILLGAPLMVTTDAGQMEKLARRYWTDIRGNATEAWSYPLGWTFYFAGQQLVDVTQYLP
jgi:hypothetical protein